MILVVGGLASGKRSYAKTLGFAEDEFADGILDDRPVVLNAQALVDVEGADLDGKQGLPDDLVDALCAKEVVTCLEIGSGVIPLDKAERVWRDRVGHLTAELAQRADSVVHMICGIPTVLK